MLEKVEAEYKQILIEADTALLPDDLAKIGETEWFPRLQLTPASVAEWLSSDRRQIPADEITALVSNVVRAKEVVREKITESWHLTSLTMRHQQWVRRFSAEEDYRYQRLADPLDIAAYLLRELHAAVDMNLSEIPLFQSRFSSESHTQGLALVLQENILYKEFVQRHMQAGRIPVNTICEIQEWGYKAPDTKIKASVVSYDPRSRLFMAETGEVARDG